MSKVIFVGLILLSGCGTQIISGPKGTPGDTGAAGPSGAQGPVGSAGPQGNQGYGAGIQITNVLPGASCTNGGVQIQNYQDLNNNGQLDAGEPLVGLTYVCNGLDGTVGATGGVGATGASGQDGTSTTFSIVADSGANCINGGFDITITDSTHSNTEYVCNGAAGVAGQAGTDGTNGSNGGTVSFSLVQAVEPCGASSSPWKEVILGLQGGQLLSSFSESTSGTNTRFSFIPNGSYVDTDESGCNFTVSGDGSTTSEISWGAGSNAYSTWNAGGYSWTVAGGWVAL